jgi:hypothetical protein
MSKPRLTLRNLIDSLTDIAAPGRAAGGDDGCYPDPPARGARGCVPPAPTRGARGCVPEPPSPRPRRRP